MRTGTAAANITSDRPVWMAGFAARDRPSEGVYQHIFAKALALDDGESRAALITTDLLFFDDLFEAAVQARLRDSLGLQPHQVILTASHTHSGPAVNAGEWPLYPGYDEAYAAEVVSRIADCAERAFAALRDAEITFGVGRSDIAIYRRRATPEGIIMQPNPDGPTDPELPVLRAGDAVVMSYACHPSTYSGYRIGGDYPGFAQRFVEERLPGAQAMFAQGCGGDVKVRNIGPDGRFQSGPLGNVERFGREFADAACAVLDGSMRRIEGPLQTRRADFDLPLQEPLPREQIEAALSDSNRWRAAWARRTLDALDRGEALPTATRAMVQVLTIGDFALVALSGEVCVEIGLHVKRLLAPRPLMVAAYAGPSVLTDYVAARHRFPEGGYEVDGNYFYTTLPAPLRPDAEDIIIRHVTDLTA